MAHRLDEHILNLLQENGEMHTKEIVATMPEEEHNLKKRLSKLKAEGKIDMPVRSRYVLSANKTQTSLNADRKQLSNALRAEDANKQTADKLMNLYDKHLEKYTEWFDANVNANIDFEQQLLFIENFKWLTMIGDKLMKRWALEHIGYDTNTRQAQEDAKAKTAEREKAELEDAPLSKRVVIVGKYDPRAEELLDQIPTSLQEMTDEEQEKTKV